MPRILFTVHILWLVWISCWSFSLHEVRTSALGGSLLLGALLVVSLVAADAFLRRRDPVARPARIPRFTLHVWAGVVAITVGSFGLVSCFLMDLPNQTIVTLPGNAPLSRWFFMAGGLFVPTVLYGALAVALGSGLIATVHRTQNP